MLLIGQTRYNQIASWKRAIPEAEVKKVLTESNKNTSALVSALRESLSVALNSFGKYRKNPTDKDLKFWSIWYISKFVSERDLLIEILGESIVISALPDVAETLEFFLEELRK